MSLKSSLRARHYGGDFVKAAVAAIPGLTALSPNYGFPQNGKVGDPGFLSWYEILRREFSVVWIAQSLRRVCRGAASRRTHRPSGPTFLGETAANQLASLHERSCPSRSGDCLR